MAFGTIHLLAILVAAAVGAGIAAALLLPPLRRAGSEAAALGTRAVQAEAEAARLPGLEAQAKELSTRLAEEVRRAAGLAATLEAERKGQREKLEELGKMKAEIEEKFGALAHKALKGNAENFLNLVSERFEKHKEAATEDLARRQQAIETMIRPVAQSLEKFETRIGEIEKAREGAYSAVLTQVRALADGQVRLNSETSKLVTALRSPKTRGRWGEFQLRQVFEMAGMVEHVDFTSEHHVPGPGGPGGARRPDAIVRLPGGKAIVVDAKTPLDAYLNAIEAVDEAAREAALKSHVRQVRAHIDGLAAKEYWNALPVTPDFVVMFVPGEAFYSAAIEMDPELFEAAISKRVLIATPTTLIALVKAIAYGWQQEKLAQNAQEVASLARQLYDRIRVFGEHMDRLGAALRSSVERYNRAVGSLEGRVLPTARRFEGLGVVPAGTVIDGLSGLEAEPRPLTASELLEAEEETPLPSR
ncbi:MAG TPA: DNA recombination protein RmuC [Thermohalobaculum sp.]|nr:DNA recombination protein RmuC [Thermohalobaculum sp.]